MKRLEEHSNEIKQINPLNKQGKLIYSTLIASILLFLALPSFAADAEPTTQPSHPTPATAPAGPDIADLILVITGEGDINSRKQAALQILQTHSAEGVEKLVKILGRQNDQPAKLAICLAIADARSQNPRFIKYLVSFLQQKEPLQQAAAQALTNYEDPKVQNQLSQYRQEQIISYLQICMNRLYQRTPQNERSTLLLEWLQSPLSVQRETAMEIMHQELTSRNAKPEEKVLVHTRSMINDRSPEVRKRLVTFLRDLRQLEDAPLLRKMLAVENSSRVREAIYHALGLLEDTASIPACTKGVRDQNENVAARAAEALGQLVELTNGASPEVLNNAMAALIERASGLVENPALRESLIDALARLAKPKALPVLKKHAGNQETVPAIRKAAIRGIGQVGDPQQLNLVFERLSQDPDAVVREAAAEVAAKLAGQVEHLAPLLQSMNPQKETSSAVRQKVWGAYQGVFQKLSAQQQWQAVSSWSTTDKENRTRKIALLQDMEKRITAPDNQSKILLVNVQETLGDTWLAEGDIQKAVSAWNRARQNNADQQIERETRLALKSIDAWLRSSSYPQQVVEYAASIKLPQIREAMANRLFKHLKNLATNNPDAARQFADLVKQKVPDQFGQQWAPKFEKQRQALQPTSQPATSTSPG